VEKKKFFGNFFVQQGILCFCFSEEGEEKKKDQRALILDLLILLLILPFFKLLRHYLLVLS